MGAAGVQRTVWPEIFSDWFVGSQLHGTSARKRFSGSHAYVLCVCVCVCLCVCVCVRVCAFKTRNTQHRLCRLQLWAYHHRAATCQIADNFLRQSFSSVSVELLVPSPILAGCLIRTCLFIFQALFLKLKVSCLDIFVATTVCSAHLRAHRVH